jgi:hypothetical protein
VRGFLYTLDGADVIQRVHRRRKAGVWAKDAVIGDSGEREVVEEIRERFPDFRVPVFPEAFVVKTVDLGDLPCWKGKGREGERKGGEGSTVG